MSPLTTVISRLLKKRNLVPRTSPAQTQTPKERSWGRVWQKTLSKTLQDVEQRKNPVTHWNKWFSWFRTWFRSINHFKQLLYLVFQMFHETFRSVANISPECNVLNSGKEEIGSQTSLNFLSSKLLRKHCPNWEGTPEYFFFSRDLSTKTKLQDNLQKMHRVRTAATLFPLSVFWKKKSRTI